MQLLQESLRNRSPTIATGGFEARGGSSIEADERTVGCIQDGSSELARRIGTKVEGRTVLVGMKAVDPDRAQRSACNEQMG